PESVVTEAGGMESLLARGEDRYGIYCVPCHGGLGDGNGLVPEVSGAAAIRPPTFHDDRMRQMPDGQLYATIANGIRNMPAYAAQIPVADRWAIVGYVRALQLTAPNEQTAMRTETDRGARRRTSRQRSRPTASRRTPPGPPPGRLPAPSAWSGWLRVSLACSTTRDALRSR